MNIRQFIERVDLEDILRRSIFISTIFLSASIMFNIEIQSIIFYVYISLALGAASSFMEKISLSKSELEMTKNNMIIISSIVTIEKAIKDIQVLCTDEDILERCKKEVISEISEISDIIEKVEG